jgi:hypothetical protein
MHTPLADDDDGHNKKGTVGTSAIDWKILEAWDCNDYSLIRVKGLSLTLDNTSGGLGLIMGAMMRIAFINLFFLFCGLVMADDTGTFELNFVPTDSGDSSFFAHLSLSWVYVPASDAYHITQGSITVERETYPITLVPGGPDSAPMVASTNKSFVYDNMLYSNRTLDDEGLLFHVLDTTVYVALYSCERACQPQYGGICSSTTPCCNSSFSCLRHASSDSCSSSSSSSVLSATSRCGIADGSFNGPLVDDYCVELEVYDSSQKRRNADDEKVTGTLIPTATTIADLTISVQCNNDNTQQRGFPPTDLNVVENVTTLHIVVDSVDPAQCRLLCVDERCDVKFGSSFDQAQSSCQYPPVLRENCSAVVPTRIDEIAA